MKTLFIKLLKLIGLRTAVSLAWKHLVLPELKKLVKQNEYDWDDKLLVQLERVVNEAIKKI